MLKTCKYKFLVIDNQNLLEINSLTRNVNQPIKYPEPVLKMDAPWDQDEERLSYTNIIYDQKDKLFKMWYCVEGSESQRTGCWTGGIMKLAYATSVDGIGWQRPELGLVEINGSKKNNYILPEKCFYGATLIDDPSDIIPTIQTENPHAILIDHEILPDQNRFQLISALKQSYPNIRIMTATSVYRHMQILCRGVSAAMTKQVNIGGIKNILDRFGIIHVPASEIPIPDYFVMD